MADVFRIVTAEGHEHDYHHGVERLKEDHPGAVITGRRVINAVGEGTYEPYTLAKAQAAERKAAADEEKPKRKGKRDEAQAEEVDVTPDAEPIAEIVIAEAPAAS